MCKCCSEGIGGGVEGEGIGSVVMGGNEGGPGGQGGNEGEGIYGVQDQ